MVDANQLHADQIAYWNGPGGAQWVAQQAHTDTMLAPVATAAVSAAAPQPGERVLDIGCGCGVTALTIAERVGPAGQVTGVDISEPMLAVARQRGAARDNLALLLADAATHGFAPASFDLMFSRFGVMFFGDPVAAFANLRRALRPGGRMVFACWRPFVDNPWMKVPLDAAYQHIPRLPKPDPFDPGPFAFADADRVRDVLTRAGWPMPTFKKLDLDLDIAAGGGLEAAVAQATNIGAASRALREAPEETRPQAVAAIRDALAAHKNGNSVALPGAVWLVRCDAP